MSTKGIWRIFTVLGMGLLILDSVRAAEFAALGIDLCLGTVIPSLFPFFLLGIYLTGNLAGGSGAIPVLISGFLGGYPVGAQTAAAGWRRGSISKFTAQTMLMYCSQAGPSFLFGLVAARFPSGKYGWMLWGVQILSALSVAALVPGPDKRADVPESSPNLTMAAAMKGALGAMALVCGWVVVFRVLLGYLSLFPLNDTQQVLTAGLLELANGCMKLELIESVPLRFFLAAVMLNFGGVCVMLQTASVTSGLDMRYYVLGKMLQTAFAILYSLVFLGHFTAGILAIAVICLFRRQNCAKNSSIPAVVGV